MIPEEIGKCVKLGDVLIPAVNIQVDGFPGFAPGLEPEDKEEWYGLYFEILFETGALWVVSQVFSPGVIEVTEYHDWAHNKRMDYPGVGRILVDWKDFLDLYNERQAIRQF